MTLIMWEKRNKMILYERTIMYRRRSSNFLRRGRKEDRTERK